MFVSKAGNKEDETIYYTYKPVDSDELYTRTKEDFFAQVGPSVTRFTKI